MELENLTPRLPTVCRVAGKKAKHAFMPLSIQKLKRLKINCDSPNLSCST